MVPPTQSASMLSMMEYPTEFSFECSKKTKGSRKSRSLEGKNPNGMSRNAARERYRVKSLRNAFHSLQKCLPSVPPNTKLSKLDVLILATTYISHLSRILNEDESPQENGISNMDFDFLENSICPVPEVEIRNPNWEKSYLHPVKKWPMRSRLYAGVEANDSSSNDYSSGAVAIAQKTTW
ncbi:transcription factor 24-like [Stegodyphus dumicola]|uniref:transcription factor 24-like n=1 Tax=Stegodyphus dumicola TaxID=202533 RepID=UPI0015B302CA|nr:transcription factor 24-like [Stegodyphus dumicola]